MDQLIQIIDLHQKLFEAEKELALSRTYTLQQSSDLCTTDGKWG